MGKESEMGSKKEMTREIVKKVEMVRRMVMEMKGDREITEGKWG
jgi:hypothetical protein